MKQLMFRKIRDVKKNKKMVSIRSFTESKECKTRIRKCFVYKVSNVGQDKSCLEPPNIYIKKTFDSVRKVEVFTFRVQGGFYMSHKRVPVYVNFHHTLSIHIIWNKDFSPKKSELKC